MIPSVISWFHICLVVYGEFPRYDHNLSNNLVRIYTWENHIFEILLHKHIIMPNQWFMYPFLAVKSGLVSRNVCINEKSFL